ncbi:MAG: methionine synthase, partial [Deltaproteobacteria bacterium]
MVPTDTILRTAVESKCDLIGLSGLITPSLDEMASVAAEMERRGIALPLLIGGATTSKQHTAVKIAPQYRGITVHVKDASRAVGVVSDLLDEQRRTELGRDLRAEQERIRGAYAGRSERPLLSYREAFERRLRVEWRAEDIARPRELGRRTPDVALAEIAEYIDWTFFFTAWELKGRFPKILDHPKYGAAARELYANGRELLDRIVREGLLTPKCVIGFWPAQSDGDDIVLYTDEGRGRELTRFSMLRQQATAAEGKPTRSLADFIAPLDSGHPDWLGAFAVTAGIGAAELAAAFERDHDDYHAIMVKALADRLAEAFAELLHLRARRDWGYGADETLSLGELIAERYRGIRPAFGYPACPDHTLKRTLFDLLDAPSVGITLTETCAMSPAASVSGLYFAHPQARYFTVGRVGRDQVEDYARRRGMEVADVERWLAPQLAYDPRDR